MNVIPDNWFKTMEFGITRKVTLLLVFLFPIISYLSRMSESQMPFWVMPVVPVVGVCPSGYGKDITITVLYNNVPSNKNLTTAWGMSCLIEGMEKTVLFDTGGVGAILLSNMKKLKINLKDIDIVVLSHIHDDHVGGIWNFLEKNNNVIVYLPDSFPEKFKSGIKKMGAEVVSVHKSIQICKNVYSTGELGTFMKEQSLLLNTEEGIIVITGCAHPGIVNIVKKAKGLLKNKVYFVLGGFHLMAYSENEVKKIIKDLKKLGVKKVGPSHCTGGRPIELFRETWGDDFSNLGCGAKITIEKIRE